MTDYIAKFGRYMEAERKTDTGLGLAAEHNTLIQTDSAL